MKRNGKTHHDIGVGHVLNCSASMACSLLLLSLFLLHGFSLTSATVLSAPAFVWSDHRSFGPQTQGAVDYRVFSRQSLVEMLMKKFGWSELLCKHGEEERKVDMIIAFIGSQLLSEDISHGADGDLDVRQILKESFSSSNYSVALPYISVRSDRPGFVEILLSTLKAACDLKSRPGKTLIMGSCSGKFLDPKWHALTKGIQLIESIEDIKEFIDSRKGIRAISETDFVIICPATDLGSALIQSEGDLLETTLMASRRSGTNSAVLYISDPLRGRNPLTFQGRLLSLNSSSSNSTCDDICETFAGVYEGIMVAITLLIILLAGLCCMMGIDTPSRFETAPDT